MTKVVINCCYGGFGLSDAAVRRYAELKGITLYPEPMMPGDSMLRYWTVPANERNVLEDSAFYAASMDERRASNRRYGEITLSPHDIERTDPILVQVVEELGEKANGPHSLLDVVDLAPGTHYRITEYDGLEDIQERDAEDWSIA